jgi:hypothetical protein
LFQGAGLGIVGGTSNFDVDTNEFVNFAFAFPTTDINYFVFSYGGTGQRILTIFGVGGGSLGTFNQNVTNNQVSSLVGNTPIESFRLTSPGVDSFRVGIVQFTSQAQAVPFEFDPAGGLVILGGFWLGRKQLKKRFQKQSSK